MNLSNAIAAEEAGSTEAETTTTSDDEIPFEANESTEGYALFADSASLVEAISVKIFGNDPVYSLLEWGMDLEDYEEIVAENDLNGQQKLDLLHKLAKSTFGGRQSELNEGYGMGWNTDQSPPKVYDNDKVDHVPYLDVFSNLPAFDHETLDGGEIDGLENPEIDGAEALDMDDFGFDRSIKGPQLPVINEERVPILFEEGNEVVTMLEMLDSINWDEVTYCPKDGELQGTPSLGPSEAEESTDKGEEEISEAEANAVKLAANPETVKEYTVNDLKKAATHITNLRVIQTMLRVESDNDPRSSAMDRLKERRNALQGSDEDDEADAEEENEASDDEAEESVENVEESEWTEADKNLMTTLVETGQAESLNDAKEQIRSL